MNHNRLHSPHRIKLLALPEGHSMMVTSGDQRRVTISLHTFAKRKGFGIRVRKVTDMGLEVTKLP